MHVERRVDMWRSVSPDWPSWRRLHYVLNHQNGSSYLWPVVHDRPLGLASVLIVEWIEEATILPRLRMPTFPYSWVFEACPEALNKDISD